jgi:hypothetical protein
VTQNTIQDCLQTAWEPMSPRARRDLLDEFLAAPGLDWEDKTPAALGFVERFSDLPSSIQGALTLAYSRDDSTRFSAERFHYVRARVLEGL